MPPANDDDRFVGRERELAELAAALDSALESRGGIVMLAGEPGIGKTRLSDEIADSAIDRGALVLRGSCYEGVGAPPYWPWIQVLRACIQGLNPEQLATVLDAGTAPVVDMIPELHDRFADREARSELDPEQARFRLFEGVGALLDNVSRLQPLVVILEDLHWADQSSLLLLEFLSDSIGKGQILLLGTYRDSELSRQHPLAETLGGLSRRRHFSRISLRGLPNAAVGDLIESIVQQTPSRELIDLIADQTEGNPFFISEVARDLIQQAGTRDTGIAGKPHDRIPEGVREAIGRRLNRLSDRCNDTLRTAAVLGREFELDQLSAVVGEHPGDDLLDALDEALASSVVEEISGQPGRYRFTHALIQQTLLSELSASRLVRLHAQAGEALENLYAGSEPEHATELATHFSEAEVFTGPEKTIRYSVLAGEQALISHAPHEAQAHFERAKTAKGIEVRDLEMAGIFLGLATAQGSILGRGELQTAADNLTHAFDLYMELEIKSLAANAATTFIPPVHGLTGLTEMLARALPLVTDGSLEKGRLLEQYGLRLAIDGKYREASSVLEGALKIAESTEDYALQLRVHTSIAFVHGRTAQHDTALHHALVALELSERLDDSKTAVIAHRAAIPAYVHRGDLAQARVHTDALVGLLDRIRATHNLNSAFLSISIVASLAGEWHKAREFIDRGLSLDPDEPRLLAHNGIINFSLGKIEAGQKILDRLVGILGPFGTVPGQGHWHLSYLAAEACLITGVPYQIELAGGIVKLAMANDGPAMQSRRAALVLMAQIAAGQKDRVAAETIYTEVRDTINDAMKITTAQPRRVLAMLAALIGKTDEAAKYFEEQIATDRRGGFRPSLADTSHDYAAMLLESSSGLDRPKIRELIDEGAPIANELDMKPLIAKFEVLEERLKSVRGGRPELPNGLTGREAEVLRLIAAGQSRQEMATVLIVSENTIGRHVSNIYSKIGVTNRAEAASFAHRHDLAN